jgi:hypothetical protein
MREPKPFVVGISWVVECAEQCRRVGEENFLVDLDGLNVAGNNKVSVSCCESSSLVSALTCLPQTASAFDASQTHLIGFTISNDGTTIPTWSHPHWDVSNSN